MLFGVDSSLLTCRMSRLPAPWLIGCGNRMKRPHASWCSGLYPLVLRVVRAHRPQRAAEEDLCQMIFIKIFQKLDQFSGTVPLEHWVSRIAVNTCINQIRAEKARPELRHADLSEEQAAVIEV